MVSDLLVMEKIGLGVCNYTAQIFCCGGESRLTKIEGRCLPNDQEPPERQEQQPRQQQQQKKQQLRRRSLRPMSQLKNMTMAQTIRMAKLRIPHPPRPHNLYQMELKSTGSRLHLNQQRRENERNENRKGVRDPSCQKSLTQNPYYLVVGVILTLDDFLDYPWRSRHDPGAICFNPRLDRYRC